MNKAIILLGSNTGDLSENLSYALSLINSNMGVISRNSDIYETDPWGNTDQAVFYNQVIELTTSYDAGKLMQMLLHAEEKMGRKRTAKWAPRIIDLDILYFNDEIIDAPGLTVPHPHLHERRFTLVPLCEILPDMIHPLLKIKNKDLLAALTDKLNVRGLKSEIPYTR